MSLYHSNYLAATIGLTSELAMSMHETTVSILIFFSSDHHQMFRDCVLCCAV